MVIIKEKYKKVMKSILLLTHHIEKIFREIYFLPQGTSSLPNHQ